MKGYFKYIWKAVNQEYENMNPIIWGEYVYPGLGEFTDFSYTFPLCLHLRKY